MFENIKKVFKTLVENYIYAMNMYGEALNRSRGCGCCA